MMWYQNSFLLDPTERRTMYTTGEKYILNVTNFHLSDFGNYRYENFSDEMKQVERETKLIAYHFPLSTVNLMNLH